VNSDTDLKTVLSTIVAQGGATPNTEAGADLRLDGHAKRISPARHLRHGSGIDSTRWDEQPHRALTNTTVGGRLHSESRSRSDLREETSDPIQRNHLRAGYRADDGAALFVGKNIVAPLVVRRQNTATRRETVEIIKTCSAIVLAILNDRCVRKCRSHVLENCPITEGLADARTAGADRENSSWGKLTAVSLTRSKRIPSIR